MRWNRLLIIAGLVVLVVSVTSIGFSFAQIDITLQDYQDNIESVDIVELDSGDSAKIDESFEVDVKYSMDTDHSELSISTFEIRLYDSANDKHLGTYDITKNYSDTIRMGEFNWDSPTDSTHSIEAKLVDTADNSTVDEATSEEVTIESLEETYVSNNSLSEVSSGPYKPGDPVELSYSAEFVGDTTWSGTVSTTIKETDDQLMSESINQDGEGTVSGDFAWDTSGYEPGTYTIKTEYLQDGEVVASSEITAEAEDTGIILPSLEVIGTIIGLIMAVAGIAIDPEYGYLGGM